jgi:aryl-alcohol dehydrogenase-like predicted oxidoreductase
LKKLYDEDTPVKLFFFQADIYSHGRSEEIVGKALKQFNIPRNRVVILTKCFFGVDDEGKFPSISASAMNNGDFVNRTGLSRKHIFDAVDASVQRLGTYIDVLQIHRLDRDTPREEIMKALNDVVESGKVRYIGASSVWTPQKESYLLCCKYGLLIDSAYFFLDGRVGIPNSPKHRRPTRLAQVHLDAELSQPHRPRRGA